MQETVQQTVMSNPKFPDACLAILEELCQGGLVQYPSGAQQVCFMLSSWSLSWFLVIHCLIDVCNHWQLSFDSTRSTIAMSSGLDRPNLLQEQCARNGQTRPVCVCVGIACVQLQKACFVVCNRGTPLMHFSSHGLRDPEPILCGIRLWICGDLVPQVTLNS